LYIVTVLVETKKLGNMSRNNALRAVFFNERSLPQLGWQLSGFRAKLFVQERGWQLPIINGLERDEFDTPVASYCALLQREEIVGCFRAIPCNYPYLASCAFPHLAVHTNYPRRSDFWEISRFGVLRSHRELSIILYSLMLRLAFAQGIKSLVALAELPHERLLQKIGLQTRRYGDCDIVGFKADGSWILAVAGEIPLTAQEPSRIEALLKLTKDMEVIDETSVFGRERISA
jgi:N-acyl-L-homoserine lactone synthetase